MKLLEPLSIFVIAFGSLISSAFLLISSAVLFVLVQETFDRCREWTGGITVTVSTIGIAVIFTVYLYGCGRIRDKWRRGLAICLPPGMILGVAFCVSHHMAAAVLVAVSMTVAGAWVVAETAKTAVSTAVIPKRTYGRLDRMLTMTGIVIESEAITLLWIAAILFGMPQKAILILGLFGVITWVRVIGPLVKMIYCLARIGEDLSAVFLSGSIPLIVALRRTLFFAALAVAGTVISKVGGFPTVLIGIFGIAAALFLAVTSMILYELKLLLMFSEPTARPYAESVRLFGVLSLWMLGPGLLMLLSSLMVNKLMGLTIVGPAILFAGLSLSLVRRKVEEGLQNLPRMPVRKRRLRPPPIPAKVPPGVRFMAHCRRRAAAFRNFTSRSFARYIKNRRRSRYRTRPLTR